MKFYITTLLTTLAASFAHATSLECTVKQMHTYLVTHSIEAECDNNKTINISGEGPGLMIFPVDTFVYLNCSNELADLNGKYYGGFAMGAALLGGGAGEFVNSTGHCTVGVASVAAGGGVVVIVNGKLEIQESPDYWGDFK